VQAEIMAGACTGSGVATAEIQFISSGRVAKVSVVGVDAATAACVAKLVRKARVPAFKKATFDLRYPFKLKR
jgi:hypothetical protein